MKNKKFEEISFAPTELGIISVDNFPKQIGELIADSKILGTHIKIWRQPRNSQNHVPGLLSLSGDSGWCHLYAISQNTILMWGDIFRALNLETDVLIDALDKVKKILRCEK